MTYQIRHREMGVYQGSCLGFGFWHPMSEMPEQGFCEFPSLEDGQEYLDFLCGDKALDGERCNSPLQREDLSVEPFDKVLSDRLIAEGRGQLAIWGREN